jgi:hypothetical protein
MSEWHVGLKTSWIPKKSHKYMKIIVLFKAKNVDMTNLYNWRGKEHKYESE